MANNMLVDVTKSTEEALQSNDRLRHHYELGKKRESFWIKKYRGIPPAEFDKINWEENLEGKGFLLIKSEPLGKTKFSDTYMVKVKPNSVAFNLIEQSTKRSSESSTGSGLSKELSKKVDTLACRVIRIKSLSKTLFSLYSKRNFAIWLSFKHSNLVNLHKVFVTNSLDKYYIFMDYGEQGTLNKYIKQTSPEGGLPVEKALQLSNDILRGLHYLHTSSIAHRKLKAENIFITANGGQAKISGFEFCQEFCDIDHNGEKSTCWMYHEHNGYNAYESVAGEPHDPFLEDIFGFGALFYFMLVDHTPFDSCKIKESGHSCKDHRNSFKRNIIAQTWTKREAYKQKENEQFKTFFISSFSMNPFNRLSTDEIVLMEMFKKKIS